MNLALVLSGTQSVRRGRVFLFFKNAVKRKVQRGKFQRELGMVGTSKPNDWKMALER